MNCTTALVQYLSADGSAARQGITAFCTEYGGLSIASRCNCNTHRDTSANKSTAPLLSNNTWVRSSYLSLKHENFVKTCKHPCVTFLRQLSRVSRSSDLIPASRRKPFVSRLPFHIAAPAAHPAVCLLSSSSTCSSRVSVAVAVAHHPSTLISLKVVVYGGSPAHTSNRDVADISEVIF